MAYGDLQSDTLTEAVEKLSTRLTNTGLVFEGATDNNFETSVVFTDPTADRTITFPNATGNVVVVGTPTTSGALTATATTGSLPTADGSITISDATTPTVTELLEYCTELRAQVATLRTALIAAGIAVAP